MADKSDNKGEAKATRSEISHAFAKLHLAHFNHEHGSSSGETAQKMSRLEAAIELERILFWGEERS